MEHLLAPDATASLGGYEWRLHELLAELNASPDKAHKATIRRQMQQVAVNYQLAHPGKELVLAPYPADFGPAVTLPAQPIVRPLAYDLATY